MKNTLIFLLIAMSQINYGQSFTFSSYGRIVDESLLNIDFIPEELTISSNKNGNYLIMANIYGENWFKISVKYKYFENGEYYYFGEDNNGRKLLITTFTKLSGFINGKGNNYYNYYSSKFALKISYQNSKYPNFYTENRVVIYPIKVDSCTIKELNEPTAESVEKYKNDSLYMIRRKSIKFFHYEYIK